MITSSVENSAISWISLGLSPHHHVLPWCSRGWGSRSRLPTETLWMGSASLHSCDEVNWMPDRLWSSLFGHHYYMWSRFISWNYVHHNTHYMIQLYIIYIYIYTCLKILYTLHKLHINWIGCACLYIWRILYESSYTVDIPANCQNPTPVARSHPPRFF